MVVVHESRSLRPDSRDRYRPDSRNGGGYYRRDSGRRWSANRGNSGRITRSYSSSKVLERLENAPKAVPGYTGHIPGQKTNPVGKYTGTTNGEIGHTTSLTEQNRRDYDRYFDDRGDRRYDRGRSPSPRGGRYSPHRGRSPSPRGGRHSPHRGRSPSPHGGHHRGYRSPSPHYRRRSPSPRHRTTGAYGSYYFEPSGPPAKGYTGHVPQNRRQQYEEAYSRMEREQVELANNGYNGAGRRRSPSPPRGGRRPQSAYGGRRYSYSYRR